jgi:asparagine synthase (glutamine-hydrolysing)
MLAAMSHRGQDGNECYFQNDFWVGVCRASRIDQQCGDRVMFNETQDKFVVGDCYIYNHRELRAQLEGRGHRFRTTSDKEPIIHLFEDDGAACVERLQGDFALAAADRDALLLACDRLGMKPLYYLFLPEDDLFLFASEIKGILQYEGFTPRLDEEKLTDNLVPRFPVGNRSFLKGIKSVRPGHTLRVWRHEGRLRLEEREYYRLSLEPDESMTLEEAKGKASELLVKAVGAYLDRSEETGLALSGGVDSTLLALTAHRYHSRKLSTYSIGKHADDLDLRQAGITATHIGSNHHEIILDFRDYMVAVPRFVLAMERPVTIAGGPFHKFCLEAVKEVKFCLIGEAADAVFGGGEAHLSDVRTKEVMQEGVLAMERLGLPLRDEVASIVSDLCHTDGLPKYIRNHHQIGLSQRFAQSIQYYNLVAMDVGLEISDPFIHHELIDFMRRVPFSLKSRPDLGIDKYLLRAVALSMFGQTAFDAVMSRKSGLGGVSAEFIYRFERMCQSALPDSYVSEHRFGSYFPDKSRLLLLDLFMHIFIENRGRRLEDLDILKFINERSGTTSPLSYRGHSRHPRRGARQKLADTVSR